MIFNVVCAGLCDRTLVIIVENLLSASLFFLHSPFSLVVVVDVVGFLPPRCDVPVFDARATNGILFSSWLIYLGLFSPPFAVSFVVEACCSSNYLVLSSLLFVTRSIFLFRSQTSQAFVESNRKRLFS